MRKYYLSKIIICSLILNSCDSEGKKAKDFFQKKGGDTFDLTINYHKEYYNNSNILKIEGAMKNNKFNGMYKAFHENGLISEQGNMIDNLKNGVWKYFDNNSKLIYVHQYFNDNLIFELDKNDFEFKSVSIDAKRYNINIPELWDINTSNENYQVLLTAVKKCNDSVLFCPNISITKDTLKRNVLFGDYINLSYESLKNSLPFFQIVAKGEVKINNFSAYQISYLMEVDGVKLGGLTTWICEGNIVYIVTGMAINERKSEFLKYKGLFQEIVQSFKVNH